MTRNEQQLYSDVTSIRESLNKIANALERSNVTKAVELSGERNTKLSANGILDVVKVITDDYASKNNTDIPGFEGTLDALDNLCNLEPTSDNPNPAGCGGGGFDGLVEYETDLQEIRVDSDHDIRSTAAHYEHTVLANGGTKKDCILNYVTNEFGSKGARYTDIIKFAYYLGEYNAPKYDNSNRGYYACAFNTRFGGHLIKGGKDQLVKGINKEGNERYFAHSFVDQATDYYRRIR